MRKANSLSSASVPYLVLGLAVEGKGVLGLAVGDLVDAEPLVGGSKLAGHDLVDVINVCEDER